MSGEWNINPNFYYSDEWYTQKTKTYALLIESGQQKPKLKIEFCQKTRSYVCPECEEFFDRKIDCVYRHALHCEMSKQTSPVVEGRGWWDCGRAKTTV